ncbi:GxGYxYP domain-containing protein [Bremerella cremea]|nr:GxGYxYP domain-containing protein [Bremerella cremea]
MQPRRNFLTQLLVTGGLSLIDYSALAAAESNKPSPSSLPCWWPQQKQPTGVIRLSASQGHSPALAMLQQSLSGLAAQGVNEGRSEELVWIDIPHPAYQRWYRETLDQTGITARGELDVWQLLARLRDQGLVHGYVVYRQDTSPRAENTMREGIDLSVNVATTLCGVLGGVLIEESLVEQARELGLTQLADARVMSLDECFTTYQDQLNRQVVLAQNPRKPSMRDLAIAHRAITLYGQDEPVPQILAWLAPLSTVLGWNGGEEWVQVKQFSEYGHVLTVSDWAQNLPLLSTAYQDNKVPQIGGLDPKTIDWAWEGACTTLVMSDGDNVQWALGDFVANHRHEYWDNPRRGEFPFSWTAPVVPLAQTAPLATDYLAATCSPNNSLVEFGGGYIFPDFFGTKRTEKDLLDKYAARLGTWMKATDTQVLCLLLLDIDSPAARHAYETFARHIPGLVGIIAMQYAPYEGGRGKVFWANDGRGGEVPVMTCRYAIWEHANRPNAGTPSQVATQINQELPIASAEDRLAWTVVHAWSWFRDSDHPAREEVSQQEAPRLDAQRGLAIADWCQQKLSDQVRAVTIEELLWRLRMAHDPVATKQRIS